MTLDGLTNDAQVSFPKGENSRSMLGAVDDYVQPFSLNWPLRQMRAQMNEQLILDPTPIKTVVTKELRLVAANTQPVVRRTQIAQIGGGYRRLPGLLLSSRCLRKSPAGSSVVLRRNAASSAWLFCRTKCSLGSLASLSYS